LGNYIINWELWFRDIFTWLSVIGCFTILVAGTYLIISDLANEQRRETLNFIRLSPQSAQSILLGKMLGVPMLLYLAVFLAIPLHLWSGLAANIPLVEIFSFYAVIIGACILYYSGALLFGLVGSWLSGFQAWLGSGAVFVFIILPRIGIFSGIQQSEHPLVVLNLINPVSLIPHFSIDYSFKPLYPQLASLRWFSIPLGS
jgi:ABC-type Na+ efflux pump permease subunit